MKKGHKILLYISISAFVMLSVMIFNSLNNRSKINSDPQIKGERKGGADRALPVSVYIAGFEINKDGLVRLGSLVPTDIVDLVSEMSGRIVSLNFKEGEFVKKGRVLVKLNDDELQSQIKRAEYQYSLLKEKLDRQKILLSKDAVSREDYDQVLTEHNVLKQDIELLKVKIDKCEIKAPFDGVIGFREVSVGAFLQPNSKIANLVDVKNLIVEFSIPEKYVSGVLQGAKTIFTVEGMIRQFSATVYAVDPQVDVKTRTIMLRARYYNGDGALRPGMSAKVILNPNKAGSSIFIPNEAVLPGVKGRSVWVVKEGKAEMVPVQTGTRTADKIEILSGISKGDSIITTGLMQIRPGIQVIPNIL